MIAYARRKGISEWKLQTQLNFVWLELHSKYLTAFGKIWATTKVDDAATQVAIWYEGAARSTFPNRVKFARIVYNRY